MKTPAITIFVVCVLIVCLALAIYNYRTHGARPENLGISKHDADKLKKTRLSGKEQMYMLNFEAAIEEYTKALRVSTTDAFLYNDRGTAYYQLGVESVNPPSFMFSIGSKYQTDLDSGSISAALQQEFWNNEFALSQNATVLVQRRDIQWRIDYNNGQVYIILKEESILFIIREEESALNIYSPPRSEDELGYGLEVDARHKEATEALAMVKEKLKETEETDSGIITAVVSGEDVSKQIQTDIRSLEHYVHVEEEVEDDKREFWLTIIVGKTKEAFLYAQKDYLKAIDIKFVKDREGRKYSNYSVASRNLGTLYFRMGRKKEAMIQWRRALELEPTDDELRELIGSYE